MSRPNRVCTFFASAEGCKFGAACNFSHDQIETYPEQTQTSAATYNTEAEAGHSARGHGQQHRRQPNQRSQQRRNNPRPCRYFLSGHCSKGDDCTFLHQHEGYEPKPSAKSLRKQETGKRQVAQCRHFKSQNGCRYGDSCNFFHAGDGRVDTRQKVCFHFMGAGCMLKDDCRMLHPVDKDGNPDFKVAEEMGFVLKDGQKTGEGREGAQAEVTKSSEPGPILSVEAQQKQRNTDIEVLNKRYPHAEEVETHGKLGPSFKVKFLPTDPDWPYDVKELPLVVYFPESYPLQMMNVSIPDDSGLPETVRRCVEFSIVDWVTARFKNFEKKGRVELMFRPFLRWLDRELEEVFTDALTHYRKELVAREAGIDIIPARHLKARYGQNDPKNLATAESIERPGETTVTIQEAREYEEQEEKEEEVELPVSETEKNKENQPQIDAANPSKRGTEVKIKDLQMKESVATLIASAIKLVVKCSRCRQEADVTTPAGRLNLLTCAKCSQTQLVRFRPAIMHAFSSVLGYLDLELCTPFDLVLIDCCFIGNCLSCNKDHQIGGVSPGMLKDSWCQACHSKMRVAMECAQFRLLQPSDIDAEGSIHKVASEKIIRNVKDPAIKEGLPLPNQGACKHYKKSYRWLRFPCCGKTYPCDLCHDDFEKGDHEMKYANRMICGFCAKEQPFADGRSCTGCGNSLTRRGTEHWEGGKGCRDVIRMSKSDDKKYSNLNKTVSRHAQAKTQTGKKTTKLRHT